jgi:uncharacterized membrane protein
MEAHSQENTNEDFRNYSPERINAFSDGVFAIIITIMILELKHPSKPTFSALFAAWPVWISYLVSYVFIAIVWINHHYVLKHATSVRLRLIWVNFAHLFSVSLIPFLTDWIAETRLESVPVVMYAFVFVLVNVTYLFLIRETMYQVSTGIRHQTRQILYRRSVLTIFLFVGAMIIAIWLPDIGFLMICVCLIIYLRPEVTKGRILKLRERP